MPAINLTDSELKSAAMAARAARNIAETDAVKQSHPSVRATFGAAAKRYQELAEKLERGRQS